MKGPALPAAIRLETRISEVLSNHPELLEELIAASPAFEKLRNPLLRRTMPRLVSVAQAARIGGLEPQALLERLNRAAGLETEPPAAASAVADGSKLGTPEPAWMKAPLGFELDVRPILQAGGEPFGNILAAAAEVAEGQRLIVDAPFEPLPLYKVMAHKGFEAWCEQWGSFFRVYFYRTSVPVEAFGVASDGNSSNLRPWHQAGVVNGLKREPEVCTASDATTSLEAAWDSPDDTLTVEANWEPPLPMQKVLEALAGLQPGQRLLVHHVRRPVHLLARLEADGVPYLIHDLGPGRVDLLLERREG